MKKIIFVALCFLTIYQSTAQEKILYQAHAHNDYAHEKPLFKALSLGFISIEADVHLVAGELYVAHYKPKLEKANTLKELYLEPLRKRILANGGKVYPNNSASLYLMIDIKTEAETTYQVLKEQLSKEAEKLKNLILKTNQQGKKLRFWASPENENVWEMLIANDIGLIGTDQLERLSQFLHK